MDNDHDRDVDLMSLDVVQFVHILILMKMIKFKISAFSPPRMDCAGAKIKLCLTMWHVGIPHLKLWSPMC